MRRNKSSTAWFHSILTQINILWNPELILSMNQYEKFPSSVLLQCIPQSLLPAMKTILVQGCQEKVVDNSSMSSITSSYLLSNLSMVKCRVLIVSALNKVERLRSGDLRRREALFPKDESPTFAWNDCVSHVPHSFGQLLQSMPLGCQER